MCLLFLIECVSILDTAGFKQDGFQYTVVSNTSFTYASAVAACLEKSMTLPMVYPSELSFRTLNKTLRATDRVFVDMSRHGDFAENQFISGQGDFIVDVLDKTFSLYISVNRR